MNETKKIMLLMVCVSVLIGVGAHIVWAACVEGFKTRFVVKDCDDQPVTDVDVTIRPCCENKTIAARTDAKGEVVFPYYSPDICERTVNLGGIEEKAKPVPPCRAGDKEITCTLRICNEG